MCGAIANLTAGCPGCGRTPDPVAAEVIRLNGEIAGLVGRVEQARQAYLTLAATLRDHQRRRNELAARVRVASYVDRSTRNSPPTSTRNSPPTSARTSPLTSARTPIPSAAPPRATPATGETGGVRPETSTRTVQNLLFILGGLLLGTAAIVFTAVAWATVGVTGRAVILAAVTLLVLAAPPVAKHRGLTATGETFAAVGLLLVLLDGYAAWSVDLFGVAGWPGLRYPALVATLGTVIAAGYGAFTRLAAPWFAALLMVQPVPVLLAVDAHLGAAGWSLTLTGLAALNLAVVRLVRGDAVALAGRVTAWVAYGSALLGAAGCGLVALFVSDPPILAGGPLLLAALLLVTGALVGRGVVFPAVAVGLLVVVLAAAAVRPVVELPGSPLLPVALVVMAITLLVAGAVSAVPAAGVASVVPAAGVVSVVPVAGGSSTGGSPPVGPVPSANGSMVSRMGLGARIGGLVTVGALWIPVGIAVLVVATATLLRSMPVWRGDVETVLPLDWRAPVSVGLAVGALVLLLPRTARTARVGTAIGGTGLVVLAVPAAGPVWWLVPVMDLAVTVGLLLATGGGRVLPRCPVAVRVTAALTGALLTGHALLVGLARPASATAVLAGILAIGIAVAVTASVDSPVERAVGGTALAVGLLAGPAALTVGLFAAGVGPAGQARGGTIVVALLVGALVAVRRWRPDHLPYATVALALAVLVPGLSPAAERAGEPRAVYVSILVGLVAVGLVLVQPIQRAVPLLLSAGLLLLTSAILLAPAVAAVLVGPYAWLGGIWSGVPSGVGLMPIGGPSDELVRRADVPAGIALAILTIAVLIRPGVRRPTRPGHWAGTLVAAAPLGATALLVGLAASGARWPVVPAVALLGGLAGLLFAALTPWRPRLGAVTVPLGVVLAGPGLVGLLPTKASTLVAVGLVVAVAAVAGVAGRTRNARLAGWLTAIGAGVAFAMAASRAAELPLRVAAFTVLGVAGAALAVGAALRGRRPVESIAVEAAGHAGALVALLLAATDLRYAAAVCTLWGVATGVRALRPGESAGRRWSLAAVAGGSELLATWLLLAAERVAVLEAYTLPAAALALVAGWLANRTRPGRNSWLTYGPGLAAALLPGLVSILVADGQPVRRLLVGAGALVAVLLGANWRRQAPVLLGGGTLALVALHEVVGVWDRLPRWIFLALGGLALIGLAMTYERRRRDLARLRAAVRRMT